MTLAKSYKIGATSNIAFLHATSCIIGLIRVLFSKEKRIMNTPDAHTTETADNGALVHGWTRERKMQFLDHLAGNGNVRAACRRVGLSREAAYRLRRRDPLFARGWAAALVKAHDASIEVLADRAIEGIEVPVYYRGELVGTHRKYDTRLLLAHIARLDKLAEDKAAQADAGRFDELLARIAGETLPAEMVSEDGVLPLEREHLANQWAEDAYAAHCEQVDEADDVPLDQAAQKAREAEEIAAWRAGRAEGAWRWDRWFANACCVVDRATDWRDGSPAPGLPGGAPLSRRECETGTGNFDSRTVSDVSTGAIAHALAGPAAGVAPPPSPVG
jgi:hypothetical protein